MTLDFSLTSTQFNIGIAILATLTATVFVLRYAFAKAVSKHANPPRFVRHFFVVELIHPSTDPEQTVVTGKLPPSSKRNWPPKPILFHSTAINFGTDSLRLTCPLLLDRHLMVDVFGAASNACVRITFIDNDKPTFAYTYAFTSAKVELGTLTVGKAGPVVEYVTLANVKLVSINRVVSTG
jgi:hypothetical protein